MPFVDRWQYADTLFIVDPWMWAVLVVGIMVSRWLERRGSLAHTRPSRLALYAIASYIALMAGSGLWARSIVSKEIAAAGWAPDARFMVAPEPLNPFRRRVVIDDGGAYRVGTLRWVPQPEFAMDSLVFWKRDDDPLARRAARTRDGDLFLQWARFPFFVVPLQPTDPTVVHIVDARYTVEPGPGFGAVAVVLDGGE
jgi:inner membrane protein